MFSIRKAGTITRYVAGFAFILRLKIMRESCTRNTRCQFHSPQKTRGDAVN